MNWSGKEINFMIDKNIFIFKFKMSDNPIMFNITVDIIYRGLGYENFDSQNQNNHLYMI